MRSWLDVVSVVVSVAVVVGSEVVVSVPPVSERETWAPPERDAPGMNRTCARSLGI